ncbi:MAG: hypothetical protein PW734_10215 [Verrucomicrobium sp.]|nr:hypothetical protein [Verrucomicrobium sp.]
MPMKAWRLGVGLVFLFAGFSALICFGQTADAPLVRFETRTLGDPRFDMEANELSRTANTSLIQVIHRKGGPTGSAMLTVEGFYLVSKARQAEYFIILQDRSGPDGSRLYTVGFTNTKNADIKATFGSDYGDTDEAGIKRRYLSVAEYAAIFEKAPKKPE